MINEKIISHYEQKMVLPVFNSNKFFEYLLCSFLFLFLALGLSYDILVSDGLAFKKTFLLICSLLMPLLAFPLFCNEYEVLHFILPNKGRREEEIRAFLEINNPVALGEVKQYNYDKEGAPFYESLERWFSKIAKGRVFSHLLHRFCEKDFLTGKYNASILSWAKNIPLERLDDNQKLELLKMNKLSKRVGYVEWVTNIEYLFSQYTPKQIMTLFYSPFEGEEYFESLLLCATKTSEVNPLESANYSVLKDGVPVSNATDCADFSQNILGTQNTLDLSPDFIYY